MKPNRAIFRIFVATAIALALTTAAIAQTESILYSFTGGSDGGIPYGGVILDSKGNLYGTAEEGGTAFGGVVYEVSPNTNGTWTEQVLYNFTGLNGGGDGAFPQGSLVFDGKGNLYGVTVGGGGISFQGTVFELSPTSNGTWTEQVLYSFAGPTDVAPYGANLIIDSLGNLYGASNSGGAFGFGAVFEVSPGSNGVWTERVLHSFTGGNDGAYPFGGTLLIDSAGNLYGNTSSGGAHDYGVLYKLVPGANGIWTEHVLFAFNNRDGVTYPVGSMVSAPNGSIYGTAFDAFELAPQSDGTWTERPLHFFTGGSDGAVPESGLISDGQGHLYGTTNTGGLHRGTVFELSPGTNGNWNERVLHRFSPTGGDGIFPYITNLVIDSKRHLYGTTPTGGSSGSGVVYRVTPY